MINIREAIFYLFCICHWLIFFLEVTTFKRERIEAAHMVKNGGNLIQWFGHVERKLLDGK